MSDLNVLECGSLIIKDVSFKVPLCAETLFALHSSRDPLPDTVKVFLSFMEWPDDGDLCCRFPNVNRFIFSIPSKRKEFQHASLHVDIIRDKCIVVSIIAMLLTNEDESGLSTRKDLVCTHVQICMFNLINMDLLRRWIDIFLKNNTPISVESGIRSTAKAQLNHLRVSGRPHPFS